MPDIRNHAGHVLSRPMRLHWAGWHSTTYDLQQAGWSFSAEQLVERHALRLALQNDTLQTFGISAPIDYDYFERHGMWTGGDATVDLAIPQMTHRERVELRLIKEAAVTWGPVDMMPQIVRGGPEAMEDFFAFAPAMARTQQIIIPEESVDELLLRILDKQQAARTEFYREQVRQDRRGLIMDAVPRQKFHAQIVSLVA